MLRTLVKELYQHFEYSWCAEKYLGTVTYMYVVNAVMN
jgi:hypothetical protein